MRFWIFEYTADGDMEFSESGILPHGHEHPAYLAEAEVEALAIEHFGQRMVRNESDPCIEVVFSFDDLPDDAAKLGQHNVWSFKIERPHEDEWMRWCDADVLHILYDWDAYYGRLLGCESWRNG